ncbi:MAG: DUF2336 domain-containing protein [Alphaproteobacteria bacterium]|jgi:uncharacterized protein (DUF2336 family)|nr:DUF2336 domain-containing protein [Alphaproteobacteria bacterium]MBT4083280.1 DUF2336 domain-containing protein [Alphaproteobacteria bacterium]MBT4545052.1 DUF2336 domain-containing protein [Alphaproteobacteria bacterium]
MGSGKAGNSQIDVDGLLKLAREKSIDGRKALLRAISDLFEGRSEELNEREVTLMHAILHQLVSDTEKEVRKAVSDQFAASQYISAEIVKELANDDIEVAFSVLRHSKLLRDPDLIEVIRNRTFEHQLAVAQRENISSKVSGALVDTENETVVVALLNNSGAEISRKTREYLVDESERVDTFQDPLLRRSDLEPDLAQKMYVWVSAAMRRHILSTYDLDQDVVDDLLEQVAVLEQHGRVPEGLTPSAAEELAANLKEEGGITPDLLVQSIADGEVRLFEALLREGTGLRKRLIERILFEPGGEGLAIAAKGFGVDAEGFEKLFVCSRRARLIEEPTIQRELGSLMSLYGKMTAESARKVIGRWRRDQSYLSAIRDLEI